MSDVVRYAHGCNGGLYVLSLNLRSTPQEKAHVYKSRQAPMAKTLVGHNSEPSYIILLYVKSIKNCSLNSFLCAHRKLSPKVIISKVSVCSGFWLMQKFTNEISLSHFPQSQISLRKNMKKDYMSDRL